MKHIKLFEQYESNVTELDIKKAAQKTGYNIGPVYHGTDAEFNEFDPEKVDGYFRNEPMKFHFAHKKEHAETGGKAGSKKKRILELYLMGTKEGHYDDNDNLIPTDADYVDIPGLMVTVRYPNQIKLADLITYDDDGNVIPLEKRFDPTNKDIRY